MALGIQVTFDSADPKALGLFWAELLGYARPAPPPGFDDWSEALRAFGYSEEKAQSVYAITDPDGAGPRIFIQKVPEPKTAKNRVHLDLDAGGGHPRGPERRSAVLAEAERAVGLGAATVREVDEPGENFCVVMSDPEGNEFCLH